MIRTGKLSNIGTKSIAFYGFLATVLLVALAATLALTSTSAPKTGGRARVAREASQRVVPVNVVPKVEPIRLHGMMPEEARVFNASIPFSTDPNPAARPFRFIGAGEDRLRALDCLSAAVLYEAGDDPIGQQAVAQVVLNRVRHPAFPKTVCSVVFQGSERRTGCQFTFTCDGALHRSYADPVWDRARQVAAAALSGSVYKPVGHATHYHTDWVVPYWSSSLDKIVAIKTHLFFRWTGWWGTPPAFRFGATGIEPRIAQLGGRFTEHSTGDTHSPDASDQAAGASALAASTGVTLTKPVLGETNVFLVALNAKDEMNFPALAARACGDRNYCKFTGWIDPTKVPRDTTKELLPEQIGSMSFTLLRDRATKFERALWNCGQFKHPPEQCMWSSSAGLRSSNH
jgi:hypothetical protein